MAEKKKKRRSGGGGGKRSSFWSWTRGRRAKKSRGVFEDAVDLDESVLDRRKASPPPPPSSSSSKKRVSVVVEPVPWSAHSSSSRSYGAQSIAIGEYQMDGSILSFTPSCAGSTVSSRSNWSTASQTSAATDDEYDRSGGGGGSSPRSSSTSPKRLRLLPDGEHILTAVRTKSKDLTNEIRRDITVMGATAADLALAPVKFLRKQTLYMRTADLGLERASVHSYHGGSDVPETPEPHYHHASDAVPHDGVDHDPREGWVALDTGGGQHAPVAPYAVEALAQSGMECAMKRDMWVPDKRTDKLLRGGGIWSNVAWRERGPVPVPPRGSPDENEVMVWSGNFSHGLYGSDLPTVRAEGVVNMAPIQLVDLLTDSGRVHEYNNMSLGRTDVLVLQDDLDRDGPFGRSITKVVKSETKPPMVRRTLEFVTLMHARRLDDGAGYLIVSRAVTQAEPTGSASGNVMRSEILMGVNVIRSVEGDPGRSVMINVNHVRSPMVPMMIAKRIGLAAASGFFNDVRALC